jgi:hypothetical protein
MRRALLIQALAYRLQEKALGGLKPATRRLLARIASDAAARRTLHAARERKIKPGTTLLRAWHGVQHRLTVMEDGVQFGGERYRSLSEVARKITGSSLVRTTFLRAEISPHGASPWYRASANTVRSISASLRKRVWSRSSTRCTHSARPAKP